jgi:hypothetical protein cdifQCD-7_02251
MVLHKIFIYKGGCVMFKKWWFWVIVILILSGIGSAMKKNDNKETNIETISVESENTESEDANLIDGKFELINGELNAVNENYSSYIIGSLKNTTSKTYSYAQVTFNLYDADGAQIGTALDNINNWEPDGLWKFKAMILEQDVASYKLVKVQAF